MKFVDIGIKRRNIFLFVVALLFVVLVFPTFVRFYSGNDSLIGSESYYHFRATKELIQNGYMNPFNPPEDIGDRSYQSRNYFFNPYHYLLVYASSIVSLAAASRVVPFLLGIAAVLLFNLILVSFIDVKYKRHVILAFLVINPAFIYTFTVSNQHSAAVVLSLLGFYFFMKPGKHNFVFSVISFAAVSFFSIYNALIVTVLMLGYIISSREMHSRFAAVVFMLALLSFTNKVSFYYNFSFTPDANIAGIIFADLGGIIGFGIFTAVLAFYGVFSNWKNKSSFMYFFLISILILVSLLYVGNVANIYLMFFMAVAAGLGFVKLYERQWSVTPVKNLAILIIVCGLVFSCVSYMNRLSYLYPDEGAVESLQWLGSNTFKDGFVLSHYNQGYLISTIARNPVIADSLMTSDYDQSFLYKVQDSIFYARKIVPAKQLMASYNIEYIYITPDMVSGDVWRRPDEGLLFLFTSRSTFENVYDKDGYQIWQVVNTTVED
ncbi:hypothetical protein HQ545_04885 [Candidatus Woesearchaeota archaeon]|nr:hypothetical protein [Candidatus Woesearchaeota archaeon]